MEQYKYQETTANIRHYSNLRFAMLTVFMAITGGLLAANYSKSFVVDTTAFGMNVIRVAGIWTSLVFCTFEIALDFYLFGFWKEVVGDARPVYRNQILIWAVRAAAVSIPVGLFFFWVCVDGR